jgi:hypothetical protein
MRTVAINEIMFFEAFERDVDFYDSYPQSAWPDLEAGDVTWEFEEDEAIRPLVSHLYTKCDTKFSSWKGPSRKLPCRRILRKERRWRSLRSWPH